MSGYAQPAAGDKFDLKNMGDQWLGSLVIAWPTEVKREFDTGKYEPTDVVVADIGIIERIDPATGKPYFFKDAFVFSKGLASKLSPRIGEVVLGRLTKRQFAQGVGWSLDDFAPEDIATADAYQATNPRNTYKQPTGLPAGAPAAPAQQYAPAPGAGAPAPAQQQWGQPPAATAPAVPAQWQAPPSAPAPTGVSTPQAGWNAPAAATPSPPAAPAVAPAPSVDPSLVAFLEAHGVTVQPGMDQATCEAIARSFPS